MKPLPRLRLRRELMIVLAIKLVLIIAIKLVFFSSPLRPGTTGTAQALLTSPSSPTATTEGTPRP